MTRTLDVSSLVGRGGPGAATTLRDGIDRRSFVKAGATLGALAAAGSLIGSSHLASAKRAASSLPDGKASAAASAAAAGSGSATGDNAALLAEGIASSADMPGVEVRHAFCQMCGPARTHCATLCYLRDGRWTNVEGNPLAGNNYGRGSRTLCAKGNSAMGVLYSPTRIAYPMRRVGEKGENKFERITWDEALDEIADKLKEQKEQYGAKSYGVLSPQYYAVLGTLGRRFLNVHGSPNYLHSAICNSQRMFSNLVTLGGANHFACNKSLPGQLNKTKLLVVWGFNSENSAINQGNPYARLNCHEKGQQVIDIRPMREGLGTKADVWVPIRPGTDCALAMGILNYIIVNDLYDHDFVDNWCSGFDELAASLTECTPEWTADKTGLEVDQITQIAQMMGTTSPMAILIGNGVGDQSADGHWTVACIDLIEAITGNLGIAGGAGAAMKQPDPLIKLNEIDVLSDRLPASDEDAANGWMAGVADLVAPETPRWFQTAKTQESGPTAAYYKGLRSIITGDPYPLRFVFAQSSNPLSATRQPKTVIEALKKLDFYVVMDTEWNSSCAYADIVLPACTNYETSEQMAVKNSAAGTWLGINQKIAEPLGESHSDWDYYCDLAVRMGYGDDFWNGDFDQCLREQLDGTGIDLDELREKGEIFVERPEKAEATEPTYQDYEKMFADLPDGKVQCANSWIGGKPDALGTGELSRVPVYRGAAESASETPELLDEYPLTFSDVHAYRLCNHSYYVNIPYLRELQPEPWVKINPVTAERYGIADGDWVRVESPHGWVKLVARYLETIAPDVLMARRGWWEDCQELGLCGYGCGDGGSEVNVLYADDPAGFDPFHSAMAKQTLVKISKLDESEIPTAADAAGQQPPAEALAGADGTARA
ncbi:MAG: molybdopterin-dependent oxidoreductase [Coriobacteriales bacterium]|jgi:thiosulfate reductase/polysulfide reductase chain A